MGMEFSFEGDETATRYYSCACLDHGAPSPQSDCWECKGTGIVKFVDDVHSVKLSGSSAHAVCDAAGIEVHNCVAVIPVSLQMWRKIRESAWGKFPGDSVIDQEMRHRVFAVADVVFAAYARGAKEVIAA